MLWLCRKEVLTPEWQTAVNARREGRKQGKTFLKHSFPLFFSAGKG